MTFNLISFTFVLLFMLLQAHATMVLGMSHGTAYRVLR
jgi:hypothetical protein